MADRNYGRWLATLALIAAGIAAGVAWHTPIEHLLGLHKPQSPAAPKQLWTCSMHPQVVKEEPGQCPICHMALVPLKATPAPKDGTMGPGITVDPAMVQNLGVQTASVTEGPLTHTIRTVGTLEEAQPNIRDINLRVSGWIRRVYITSEGQHVEAGTPLFDLYSPELQLAIEELIAARRASLSGGEKSPDAIALSDSAARKLELLGLDRAQVDALSRLDKAPDTITFKSPISGHITEKTVVEGAAVKSGDRVLRLVDHTTLWIDAQVFERDLTYIKIGSKASATVASRPRNTYDGQIVFIHPHVDMTTRAAVARLEVKNAGLALKPGMYATVRIETLAAEHAVLVPREAIIDSGDSQIALVMIGEGRFEPRRVKTGLSGDDGMIQIVAGLTTGEQVVTSGQFLLDSESRLRESLNKYLSTSSLPLPEGRGRGEGSHLPAPTATPPPPLSGPLTAPQSAALDATVRTYLDLSDTLGATQTKLTLLNVSPLIAAARELRSTTTGTPLEPLASAIVQPAEFMQGKALDQQRESFKALSEALITLVNSAAPTRSIGDKLYIMECPMAPGRWIQRTDELANPFYPTDMKECGSHSGIITTRGETKP